MSTNIPGYSLFGSGFTKVSREFFIVTMYNWNSKCLQIKRFSKDAKNCSVLRLVALSAWNSYYYQLLGRLIDLSYFAFCNIWNTRYTLFVFHSSIAFLMSRKKKPIKPLMFRKNATPVAKWCKIWKKDNVKYTPINFLSFTFHERFMLFCDKCIAGLTNVDL